MTTPTLKQTLAALPERQLKLLAFGALAIAAALALTAIRAPLAALRQQQARLAALAATDINRTASPLAAMPRPAARRPAPTPLALIDAVSAGAQQSGVVVTSAVPGPERTVAGLRRQTLDIEASGDYAALLAWIAGIEASQPSVGLVHLDMRPASEEPRRLVRLQLGIYSQGKTS